MAEGHSEFWWHHTAALLSLTAEINRDHTARSDPFTVADFHPHLQDQDAELDPDQLDRQMAAHMREFEGR